MNKTMLKLIRDNYRKGLHDGFDSMAVLMIIAIHNTNADHCYFDDDVITGKFCRDIETELNRLVAEIGITDGETMPEQVAHHVTVLRERYGMAEWEVVQ